MSSPTPSLRELRRRTLNLYDAVTFLMLLGIGVLIVYCLRLGSLAGPGAQQSFGYAISLMALMGAVIVHLVDRTYRVWPLGRRITPVPPGYVSVQSQANFVRALIVIATVAAVAYLVGALLL